MGLLRYILISHQWDACNEMWSASWMDIWVRDELGSMRLYVSPQKRTTIVLVLANIPCQGM